MNETVQEPITWEPVPGLTPAQRCRLVADRIDAEPEHFDMMVYIEDDRSGVSSFDLQRGVRPSLSDCGSVACMAGHAILATPPDEVPLTYQQHGDNFDDIDGLAAHLLCLPLGGGVVFHDYSLTASDAAYLLRVHANRLEGIS